MIDVTTQVNALAERVHDLRGTASRLMVAIAGPPGAGKSTVAEGLGRRLTLQKVSAAVVPMDGFHLDNAVLAARGLLPRKGAPESFDAAGFVYLARRLRAGGEVVYPVFDRARDIAVAGVGVVPADTAVVILEGNYLLFDEPPWAGLPQLWDLSARIDVPLSDLRGRLIQRWLTQGLSRSAATARAERNDIPNAARVIERALPADLHL